MTSSKAILRQYIATFSCLLCSMMTAVCFTWYAPLTVWLLDPSNNEIEGLDIEQLSWLVAIIEVGELLGPVPGRFVADRWGRKVALLLTFPLIMTSWIIHGFTRSLSCLFVARMLQGLAIGFINTSGPPYLAEIAQPNLRGELCGFSQTMWFVGVLYCYSTGPFLSYQNYIYVSTIPAVLFFVTFVFMPESPYLLLMKSDVHGAEKSLMWLRGDADVAEELKSMRESVEKEKTALKGGWKDLIMAPSCRKPLIIITVFGFVKYLTGTATNFITQTFDKSNGQIPADYISIVMSVFLLASTIVAAFLADRLGRRPLVIISTFLVAMSSSVLAIYFFFESETHYDLSGMEWMSYIGFIIYCVGVNLGLGPLMTTFQAEYFPSNLRSTAGIYCSIMRNTLLFISLNQYQLFNDYLGVYTNFASYSIVSFLGLIVLYRYIEETANKSLGEIQNVRAPNLTQETCIKPEINGLNANGILHV